MSALDAETREYLESHFKTIYAKFEAAAERRATQDVLLATLAANHSNSDERIKALESRAWHGVGALIAGLGALVLHLFKMGK